jgi:hypothetical protein
MRSDQSRPEIEWQVNELILQNATSFLHFDEAIRRERERKRGKKKRVRKLPFLIDTIDVEFDEQMFGNQRRRKDEQIERHSNV